MLEKLFGGTKCKGTEGLIKEGEKMMGEDMEDKVRDAAIIASAQKIEHYEISGYGTARAYAMQLGFEDIEQLLTETLNEEYEADDNLTALALFDVNLQASE
jgi:ferritin-like metal-binding protein YciE